MNLKKLLLLSMLSCGLISAVHAAPKAKSLRAVGTHQQVQARQKVNLNRASEKQLTGIVKGIGKRRAMAIVAYRKKHGKFKSLNDLVKVRGISQRFIEKNRKQLQHKLIIA